jgi:hypothetical protein
MMNKTTIRYVFIGLLWAANLLAAYAHAAALQLAVVRGVQAPAWLDVNGKVSPLKEGQLLQANAVLQTGKHGRVKLDLPDGSDLLLTGNTRVALSFLVIPETRQFKEGFRLVFGALRFITAKVNKLRERTVAITVPSATVGIRGTDFYVESDQGQDKVCLFEGIIEIAQDFAPPYILANRFDFYRSTHDGTATEIGTAKPEQVSKWKGSFYPFQPEEEPAPSKGGMVDGY